MKRTIHLTDDNWADYFGNTYAESLVKVARPEEQATQAPAVRNDAPRRRGVAGTIRRLAV
jgi:hypothetical protein